MFRSGDAYDFAERLCKALERIAKALETRPAPSPPVGTVPRNLAVSCDQCGAPHGYVCRIGCPSGRGGGNR